MDTEREAPNDHSPARAPQAIDPMTAPTNADLFVAVADVDGLRRRRNGTVSPLRAVMAELADATSGASRWYRLPPGRLAEQAALKRIRRAVPEGRPVRTATLPDGVRVWSLGPPRGEKTATATTTTKETK